ncbi:MAG: MFS transporter [Mailhella sp.]|nr:MFS transporter [Mailhella sp.]
MHTYPRQKSVIRLYFGLLLTELSVFAMEYVPQPLYNGISAEFGVGRSITGLLVSVCLFSLTVSPLFVGVVLDRVGVRRALIWAACLLGASSAGVLAARSFSQFLAVRAFQAAFIPVVLTAVMTAISMLFRHMDLKRALAGYITASLAGSLLGRVGGGLIGQYLGWRLTVVLPCLLFLAGACLIRKLPDSSSHAHGIHDPRLYARVLRQPGVGALLFAEACGMFVFGALGNLLPFRMAELGHAGEGVIGFMYAGYSIGLAASVLLRPLRSLLGKTSRLLLFGMGFYLLAIVPMAFPSAGIMFAGMWLVAFGQFVVHTLCPGIITALAMRSKECERSMVSGLFLSCTYFGGLLGSFLPGIVYGRMGWTACYACLQLALAAGFAAVVYVCAGKNLIDSAGG